jgi:hypothetical protein
MAMGYLQDSRKKNGGRLLTRPKEEWRWVTDKTVGRRMAMGY